MSFRLDFPGNERVRLQLQRALESGRVAGSYLFEGAPGGGQEQAAVALAAALIGGDADPGNEAARRVRRFAHPDLHYLLPVVNETGKAWSQLSDEEYKALFHAQQAAKSEDPYALPRFAKQPHLPIQALRLFLRIVTTKSFEGGAKVIIIRDADRMQADAQDTLLKSLEEPPPDTTIILISTRPEALRPTILSRCQRIPFDPLPLETIVEILAERGADAERAELLAVLAEGDLERAVQLADAESEEGNALLEQRREWLDLLEACDFGSEIELMDAVQTLLKSKAKGNVAQERADFLSLVLSWYRELLRRRLHGGPLQVHRDQGDRLRRYAGLDEGALVERIHRCEKARGQILAYVHAELTLLTLFFSFRSGAAAARPA
jgi:DNA polymerase-3 subunit delta'